MASVIDDLCDHQVDGLVLGVRVGTNIDFVRKLCRGVPFVTLDAGRPDVPTVIVDQQQGMRLATQHLLQLGHRRIAVLAWPEASRVGNDRMSGYFRALAQAGQPADPGLIARGLGSFEQGLAATTNWLGWPADQRPTGVVALDDHRPLLGR